MNDETQIPEFICTDIVKFYPIWCERLNLLKNLNSEMMYFSHIKSIFQMLPLEDPAKQQIVVEWIENQMRSISVSLMNELRRTRQ